MNTALIGREARLRRLAAARLYFVCDGRPGGLDPSPLLEAALAGGVDLIQLRDKSGAADDELCAMALPFRRAATRHGALFVLNDRPDLVSACQADGVHVGQGDTPVAAARRLAGAAAIVGLSTHSAAQLEAARAARDNARPDQISVGPIWSTPTKPGRAATGLELIRAAARGGSSGDPPWFAIGGIDLTTIGGVVAAGAERAVVVRAIRDAGDPGQAARGLCAALSIRSAERGGRAIDAGA